jgi:hypothetical protein
VFARAESKLLVILSLLLLLEAACVHLLRMIKEPPATEPVVCVLEVAIDPACRQQKGWRSGVRGSGLGPQHSSKTLHSLINCHHHLLPLTSTKKRPRPHANIAQLSRAGNSVHVRSTPRLIMLKVEHQPRHVLFQAAASCSRAVCCPSNLSFAAATATALAAAAAALHAAPAVHKRFLSTFVTITTMIHNKEAEKETLCRVSRCALAFADMSQAAAGRDAPKI